MKHARVLALVAACSACIACGGGSGASDGGTTGEPSTLVADFIAEENLPPSESVALSRQGSQRDLVTVRASVRSTDGVYGAAFDLTWDGTMADFMGWSKGEFLEQGGNKPTYQVSSPSPGLLVVGATRTGNVAAVDVSGTRALVNLTFRVKKSGTNSIEIHDPVLYDVAVPPQPLTGIRWFAGALIGNQGS